MVTYKSRHTHAPKLNDKGQPPNDHTARQDHDGTRRDARLRFFFLLFPCVVLYFSCSP